ncbi:gibberellin 20-oxidase-like protein [Ricinus communis]|uniref:Gibberellin 20-oxidase, putative n=1 Tax=Ricinus communis TaxID=3988 RepID=B9RDS1_RICCO|nr:gibberellin 20-oxidase-like protein [Ricinus communis]EEF50529.1 gibberellin 20-oxidase, putative [Ricinus communis]|eukprot:XP_002511860.1 gibberellin 20-oxidase-like protein [Ricinus communis]
MPGCQTSVELPILDISKPINQSSLSSLAEACKEWGFFNITNHGISKQLYNKIYLLSQNIFSLPSEIKFKLGPSSSIKTYTPHFIASPYFESLRVSGPNFLASAQSSADVLFNQQNSEFSDVLQEYGSKMTELSKRIVEMLLLSLGDGLDKKFYETEFNNCHGYLRIVNYTPPKNLEDEVEGLGMHTDMSCITIVYQDEIGGLQVKSREGKWMDISPCEETLVVNIGDMLQAWSNEKFRSSEHQVVLKQSANRLSLAFFWCFEDQKVISAPDEVVGEGCGRIYKPFVCSDYLKFRESNERGKFEKVGFTVKDFAGLNL